MSPHQFTVRCSETVHTGSILALRRDEVVMPGGRIAIREVVEHPGAVAVVPMTDDGSVLMIDQYRHPLGTRLRELPAGLLDAPDEDPAATAQRELIEEIGCTARDWALLIDVVPAPGFSDESVRVFLARGLTDVGRPARVDDEEADLDVVRLPLAEAVRQVLAGDIVNASTAAGVLATQAVLAGAVPLRPVTAPWPYRPSRFADRRG